jgi:cobaltochelatase CobT
MDEATLAANGHEYLDLHLRDVVTSIEHEGEVQLAAIGIGVDVSQFYRNATRIAGIEELGPALTNKLVTLLDQPAPKAFR